MSRPLDDRNWLVLPFDNITRDPSLEVVRDASVTLLYSAMSQWSDILVVDDTRVADLMRGVPANTRMGQEAGFDLARRVGAGKLVMGTLLKEGPRTRLQAAVFDVRSGRRLRSPSLTTVGTDSLSMVFAGLAQQVLAVAAPSGAQPSDVGTQNTEALRAYVAGLETERRLAHDSAVLHYRKAVTLDSTFGLAHYHLSLTLDAVPDEDPAAVNRALEAAQRFSASLPRRERGQVAVSIAIMRGDARAACGIIDRMLETDSLDAWAWWRHSDCRLQLIPADTGRMWARLKADNGRVADLNRALELDSTFFQPLSTLNGVFAVVRAECSTGAHYMVCADSNWFESIVVLEGDTIVHRLHRPYVEGRAHQNSPETVAARRRRLELSRDRVSRFLIANPSHIGAHFVLAATLIDLGDLDGGERELAAARGLARMRGFRRQYYLERFHLELIRKRPALANAFADSIYDDATAGAQPQAGSIVGRYSLDANARHRGSDTLLALRKAWLPVFAGILPADWDRLLDDYANALAQSVPTPQREITRKAVVNLGNLLAFWKRRRRPAADTGHADPIYRFQAWFALGDTASARRALVESDAELNRRPREARDDGAWMFNAEAHVMLADSAAALSRLRDYAGRWPWMVDVGFPILMSERPTPVNSIMRSTGRVWLLYADLAAAAGSRDEARQAYQFVVDLWARGEPPVQPLVQRARAAIARLTR